MLEGLASDAKAGKISGLAFVVKYGQREHRAGAAGDYRHDPEQALSATARMKRHLMED